MFRLRKSQPANTPFSLETIQEFLDAAEAALLLITPEHTIGYMNSAAERQWGKAIGKRCFEVLRKEGAPCEDCPLPSVLSDKMMVKRTIRMPSGDTWCDRENLYMYVTGPLTKTPFMAIVSTDMPERKHLAREVRREREISKALLESVNALVIGLDDDGEVMFVNRALEQLSEYSETEIKDGGGIGLLIPHEYQDLAHAYFGSPPSEQRSKEAVLIPLIKKSGTRRMLSWTYSPLVMGDGGTDGAIALGQDVTERFARRREAEKLAEELLVVNTILSRAGASQDIDEMLTAALNSLLTLPGYRCGVVYHLESGGSVGRRVAMKGFEKSEPARVVQGKPNAFPGNAVMKKRIETAVPTAQGIHPHVREISMAEGIKGVVSVPLYVAGRPVGVLLLGHDLEPGKAEAGFSLLRAAADALELGAENAFLRMRAEERAREATSLFNVAQSLTGTLDLTSALVKVAAEAAELLDVDACNIWLFDEESETLRPEAGHDWTKLDKQPASISISASGIVSEARATLKPVMVDDAARDERSFDGEFRKRGVKSALVVPLVTEGKFTGALSLETLSRKRRFLTREAELMESFARQASIAIHNASLVKELRESEERYRALADGSLFGLLVHDGENVLYANSRIYEMSGYDRGELQTMADVFAALEPAELPEAVTLMQELIDGGTAPQFYHIRIRRRDGSVLVAETLNTIITVGGRQVVMVTIIDVTQRVTVEEALKTSEERYRILVESSRDAIFIADPKGNVLFANSASCDLTGMSSDEMIGRNIYSVVHPDERQQVIRKFAQGWDSGKGVARYPIRVVVDGQEKYFETTTAVLGERGPGANAMVIVSDITGRVKAQRMLEESEERYRTIVENSRDLIVMSNRAGEILYANPSAVDIFGVAPEGVPGKYLFEFVHPDDKERVSRDFLNDWKTGRTIPNYPLRLIGPGGKILDIEANSGLVGWPGEDTIQIFVLRDVTERKQQEGEKELQLRIEEALAAIATRFVDPPDMYEAIRETLENAGELLAIDRAFYFELSEEGEATSNLVEWVSGETSPIEVSLGELQTEDFSWWAAAMQSRKEIAFESIQDLPPGADKETIARYGIHSMAVVPVFVRDKLAGAIGFNSNDDPHSWSSQELNLLKEIAQTVTRALERKRWIEQLGRSERFRTRITDSIGEGLYVVTNGEITWANRQISEILGYDHNELIGTNGEFLLPRHRALQEFASELIGGLMEEGIYVSEDKIERKDGTLIDVVTSFTSLGLREDGAGEILCAVRDITESKKMQEAVAAAAEAYATLFSAAGDGMLVHTVEGVIMNANERASLYTGHKLEELVGMSLSELLTPDAHQIYIDRIDEMMRGGVVTFEANLRRKDGKFTPAEVTARRTRIWGENVVLSAVRDVTERHKAEEETKRRAMQLVSLNEIVKAATSSLDLETAAETILQVTSVVTGAEFGMIMLESSPGKEEYIQIAAVGQGPEIKNVVDPQIGRAFVTDVMWARDDSIILDLTRETSIMPREVAEVMRESGFAEVLLIPLRSGEKIMGFIGLGASKPGVFKPQDRRFYDAAGAEIGVAVENALIYRELAAEHERLSLLYRSAQGISGELELEALLNRTAAEAARAVGAEYALIALAGPDSENFNWSAAYGIELNLLDGASLSLNSGIGGYIMRSKRALIVPGEDEITPEQLSLLQQDPVASVLGVLHGAVVPLVAGDRVLGGLILQMDRERRGFSSEDVLLLEAIGRQAGVAIQNSRLFEETRLHLEALEKAHQELMALDRMKSDFVSTVSHELRSPLAVIEGFAKTMVEHFDQIDRETERESLEIILKKSIALEGLIENILDMSRIEEGRLEVARDRFELVGLCEHVRTDQETVDESHEVQLEAEGKPIMVVADREKTEMALGNLIRNAVKFSPDGGTVLIRASHGGNMAEVRVEDDGIGIPPEELERIFDRFYQVDSGERRSFPGSGLGLYITKELVQAMGGTIAVTSEPGRGSAFTFTLPLAG